MRKPLQNFLLGENLEDLHLELEHQRSARQPMLFNSVLADNLEDDAPTTRNWNVNGLLDKSRLCRHFHQLFRQLRFAKDSRRDVLEDDLGHVDNLLGNHKRRRVKETQDVHQLFHHQRQKIIEDLYHGSKVGKLLHGVPLDPPLRPWRLCQAGRPPPAGLFVVQAAELWMGERFFRDFAVWFNSNLSWCVHVARAAPIDCCSCRHHDRSRGCLRR